MKSNRDKLQSTKGVKLSGGCCVICGWNKRDISGEYLAEGAHIRKYSSIKDYDKHDNIIALCPNHHTEFDRGILTIDFDSKTCRHVNKNDEFHNRKIVGKIDHVQRGYFEYHRVHYFEKALKRFRS